MRQVPKGKLITLNEIGSYLAKKHNADYGCTLITGIAVMIVANATEETDGNVPYWRTIKNSGELNGKFPGGVERHKELLEKEGFRILQKGKKFFVADFERYLYHSEF
jgi:alkylated DNA nucleotide flippase Atl1